MVDLEAIRKRADAATVGPWRVSSQTFDERPGTEEVCDLVNDTWIVTDGPLNSFADDALFIAHAREDVPALLDLVAQHGATICDLRAKIARLESTDDALELVEWRRQAREARTVT